MRKSFIEFHLEQAERYSRALSDPMYISEYSARFLAQSISYHRSMADWYTAEPERPKEEYDHEKGVTGTSPSSNARVADDNESIEGNDSNSDDAERTTEGV